MGMFFTWDSVRWNRIPALENFSIVGSNLRKELAAEKSIIAALLCGSIVRGDYGRRSDINCAVAYDTHSEELAMRTLQRISAEAQKLHVSVNFIPCDNRLAESGKHHFGPMFMDHLSLSAGTGGTIKGNIFDLFAPSSITKALELDSYLRVKIYSLQESLAGLLSYSQEKRAGLLKKAFEAPIHAARRILAYEEKLDGDSKRDVYVRYQEAMDGDLADMLQGLVALDEWYTNELESQLKTPDQTRYRDCLAIMEREIGQAIVFLRENLIRLHFQ